MVRIDKDLKRCYFYRMQINGDVRRPDSPENIRPQSPVKKIETPVDIYPYNPHFRRRAPSRQTSRPSTRRISWSRDADRVREISPRSEPETNIFIPPVAKTTRSYSEDWTPENKYPIETTQIKKKKKKKKPEIVGTPVESYKAVQPVYSEYNQKPVNLKSASTPKLTPVQVNNSNLVRNQRDIRYQSQKQDQKKRKTTSNLRKVKSESNLWNIQEPLMKRTTKTDTKKNRQPLPPRWRHVGNPNKHRKADNYSRSYVSDYHF